MFYRYFIIYFNYLQLFGKNKTLMIDSYNTNNTNNTPLINFDSLHPSRIAFLFVQ